MFFYCLWRHKIARSMRVNVWYNIGSKFYWIHTELGNGSIDVYRKFWKCLIFNYINISLLQNQFISGRQNENIVRLPLTVVWKNQMKLVLREMNVTEKNKRIREIVRNKWSVGSIKTNGYLLQRSVPYPGTVCGRTGCRHTNTVLLKSIWVYCMREIFSRKLHVWCVWGVCCF